MRKQISIPANGQKKYISLTGKSVVVEDSTASRISPLLYFENASGTGWPLNAGNVIPNPDGKFSRLVIVGAGNNQGETVTVLIFNECLQPAINVEPKTNRPLARRDSQMLANSGSIRSNDTFLQEQKAESYYFNKIVFGFQTLGTKVNGSNPYSFEAALFYQDDQSNWNQVWAQPFDDLSVFDGTEDRYQIELCTSYQTVQDVKGVYFEGPGIYVGNIKMGIPKIPLKEPLYFQLTIFNQTGDFVGGIVNYDVYPSYYTVEFTKQYIPAV